MSGLSPAVIAYATTGNRDAAVEHITIEDIPDPVLQDKLHKVILKALYVYVLGFHNIETSQFRINLILKSSFSLHSL